MGILLSLAMSTQFFLLYLLFSSTFTNCSASLQPTHVCHTDESHALLQFKGSFVISKHASYNPFSYPKTASWMAATDCCSSWDGIKCDELTGHVIGIDLSSSQLSGSMDANSSLFSLVNLQSLDLSDNDFNHSQIPGRIGEFLQLKHLNLSQTSESTFSGEIPPQVSHLSSLLSLDLRSYTESNPLDDSVNQLRLSMSTLRSLAQNSTRLQELHLSFVNISSSPAPDILRNLANLQILNLSNCELYGEFPVGIFHLPNLRILDLENNQNLRGMLPNFQSSSLISMLNLQGTSFNGTLPASIGNLTSLNWLSISQCNFHGSIPSSFGNLNQLVHLDLGSNRFTIESFPLSFVNLTQLCHLSLRNSSLGGQIPSWIMNLTTLNYLDLTYNNLHGEIPHSIFRLENLATLLLGFNSLQGQLELGMFLKIKKLTRLHLSYNKWSLLNGKGSSNVTLPPIKMLDLESCNLTGGIPSWIMNLTGLHRLGLQENKLQGEIPHSLFTLENLESLSLSGNSLEGQFEIDMFLKFKMLSYLALANNKLSLLIGKGSSNATVPPLEVVDLASCNLVGFPSFLQDLDKLQFLGLSNNNLKSLPSWLWEKQSLETLSIGQSSLTGKISPMICNLKSLLLLDLAYNNLSGLIPSCLGSNSQSLQILMLQGNKLFGHLPQTYMIGSALKMLDVSDNNLQGQLPRALVNCRMLEFLDVSNNLINDSFPCWLGSLPELKVIGLRHNDFYGAINCPSMCSFPKLHILDLSHNKFSGNLSSELIKNWKSMTTSNTSQLQYQNTTINFGGKNWFTNVPYSFTMSNKGIVTDYDNIQAKFYFMVAIDLSGNRISGEIPDAIGDLKSLVFLNLSNNMLTGNIPSSLGKLSNLEALDLSLNSLSGKIPQELTELTFLEFFNVSFNKLSGAIPEKNQLLTFQGNSFKGNQGLCGIQLPKKCEGPAKPPPLESNDDDDDDSGFSIEFDWKIILIGYGGGVIAGLALGRAFGPDILAWGKRKKIREPEFSATIELSEQYDMSIIDSHMNDSPMNE